MQRSKGSWFRYVVHEDISMWKCVRVCCGVLVTHLFCVVQLNMHAFTTELLYLGLTHAWEMVIFVYPCLGNRLQINCSCGGGCREKKKWQCSSYVHLTRPLHLVIAQANTHRLGPYEERLLFFEKVCCVI